MSAASRWIALAWLSLAACSTPTGGTAASDAAGRAGDGGALDAGAGGDTTCVVHTCRVEIGAVVGCSDYYAHEGWTAELAAADCLTIPAGAHDTPLTHPDADTCEAGGDGKGGVYEAACLAEDDEGRPYMSYGLPETICVGILGGTFVERSPGPRCEPGQLVTDAGVSTPGDADGGEACQPGSACNDGDECSVAVVECVDGAARCAATGLVPDGTPCSSGACVAGECIPCAAGAACEDEDDNECTDGVVDCSSGEPVCVATPRDTGAGCRGGVCSDGTCNACAQGEPCDDGNDCTKATLECASGVPVCTTRTNLPAGSACEGGVCLGGSCSACVASASCDEDGNECTSGALSCASGTPVCMESPLAAGAPCDNGAGVCGGGTCNACDAGAPCDNGNACVAGVVRCDGGFVECADGDPEAASTPCGVAGSCNGAGQCSECDAGGACDADNDPCTLDALVCGDGGVSCEQMGQRDDGSHCGSNKVCHEGACVSCTQGATCTDPDNPCRVGVVSCGSGAPVCGDYVDEDDGVTCGPDAVCDGGVCEPCAAGDSCSRDLGECRQGVLACGNGVACVDDGPAPDDTPCRDGAGLCEGGSCLDKCVAGGSCRGAGECQQGTLQCAGDTGTPTCGNLTDVADDTPCTGGRCQAGACVQDEPVFSCEGGLRAGNVCFDYLSTDGWSLATAQAHCQGRCRGCVAVVSSVGGDCRADTDANFNDERCVTPEPERYYAYGINPWFCEAFFPGDSQGEEREGDSWPAY